MPLQFCSHQKRRFHVSVGVSADVECVYINKVDSMLVGRWQCVNCVEYLAEADGRIGFIKMFSLIWMWMLLATAAGIVYAFNKCAVCSVHSEYAHTISKERRTENGEHAERIGKSYSF